ncbi:glycosyltransferase family 2 protein [Tsuneonella amylolytica]|uniref:glycosyltransferase family 2 protein n=1 Tax=Tsuneonella amylolytica TaxID=2338327 RepID=UPI000EA8F903|nr:glycosyltransferase family 2 protein [Tsuneonella amylolytica]
MIALFVAQWAICLPAGILFAWFTLEVYSGLRPIRLLPLSDDTVQWAVLIPAHNEASIIADTISSLLASDTGGRVVVVADNCRDDTADKARAVGAEVIERHDRENVGKGHALAFGRDHLMLSPVDAVVVLDADCRISLGGTKILAQRASSSGKPVQAANLIVGGSKDVSQIAISNFAMMVKNLFRARGMIRLGGSGLLFGTGMAFPWQIFATLPLATSDATEDLKLGLDLAERGQFALLADDVHVTSPPAPLDASRGQRSRWEHGFIRTMARRALPLLLKAVRTRSRALFVIGMHMIVPPVALLVAFGVGILVLSCGLALLTGHWIPTLVLLAMISGATTSVLLAWKAGGHAVAPLSALARVPQYVLWKLPIYANLLRRRRQIDWNRTKRD